MRDLERSHSRNSLRWAAVPLAASSLILSGLMDGEAEAATQTQPQHQLPTQKQLAEAYRLDVRALYNYRKQFDADHKVLVELGGCVAWATQGNKIAVTLNPGVAIARKGTMNTVVMIFDGQTGVSSGLTPKPDGYLMNGPYEAYFNISQTQSEGFGSLETQSMTLIGNRGMMSADVTVSAKPQKLPDGQTSYVDTGDGAPVIDTVVTNGPYKESRIGRVCLALGLSQY